MARGPLARKHLTAAMRDWTDTEVCALYYFLEQPHLMKAKHKAALLRVTKKIKNEHRTRFSTPRKPNA